MPSIIELKNIEKKFGQFHAVKNLNLTVERGSSLALLGPNGAGKSTTIEMMLGLRKPTNGTLTLFGDQNLEANKNRIGASPQATDFPPQLTPREIINFTRNHFQNPKSIDELIEDFQLQIIIDRRTLGFSGGEKRRLALALAFAGNPELVFLDEPTNGLDIELQMQFQHYVKTYAQAGNTVILTSHNWAEIEKIADYIVMLDQGEKIIEGKITSLRASMSQSLLRFKCQNPLPKPFQDFVKLNDEYVAHTHQADDIIKNLVKNNVNFYDLSITSLDLQNTIEAIRHNGLAPAHKTVSTNEKAA